MTDHVNMPGQAINDSWDQQHLLTRSVCWSHGRSQPDGDIDDTKLMKQPSI